MGSYGQTNSKDTSQETTVKDYLAGLLLLADTRTKGDLFLFSSVILLKNEAVRRFHPYLQQREHLQFS